MAANTSATEKKADNMTQCAKDQNWRTAVDKETELAKSFQENWGFLAATDDEVKKANSREFEIRMVKYYHGAGNWTVRTKRIGVQHGEAKNENGTRFANDAKSHSNDGEEHDDSAAIKVFLESREIKRGIDNRKFAHDKPTSCDYGQTGNLEIFGVGGWGKKRTMTKLPPFGGDF